MSMPENQDEADIAFEDESETILPEDSLQTSDDIQLRMQYSQ
jgi:hypothetical protein